MDAVPENATLVDFAGNDYLGLARETPVIAMILADGDEATRLSKHFLCYGIRIPYFKYPAEPHQNMLRAVARSCYTGGELSRFGNAVESWSRV